MQGRASRSTPRRSTTRNSRTQTPELKLWVRRLLFVFKSHLLTFFTIGMSTVYLQQIMARQKRLLFFRRATLQVCTYRLLYFTGFAFWCFLFVAFTRRYWMHYTWWFQTFVTFVMAWLVAPLAWLPLISAKTHEWYYAMSIVCVYAVIYSLLALFKEPIYDFRTDFFINWTIRGYVLSSLGVVLAIAWRSSHTDVWVAVAIILYDSILIFLLGRTIGSEVFYETHIDSNQYLFIILNLYNFVSLYTHILLVICKIRCVVAPYKQDLTTMSPPINGSKLTSADYTGNEEIEL